MTDLANSNNAYKMKIAIYTCNFGNYRNEFVNYFNVILDKNIDYFLFTDKLLNAEEKLKLKNWNVCNINILPSDQTMDGNRWTSKYVKFVLPEILKNYDAVVWIDSKMFKKIYNLNYIKYNDITTILRANPSDLVFNTKHTIRKTMQEELIATMGLNLENNNSGKIFLNYIKNYKSKFDLVDTCFLIRRTNSKVNQAFEYCFELMKKYKLKRDQNIYNYALDQKNIKPLVIYKLHDLIVVPKISYYNSKIQLSKKVIHDVFLNTNENTKMLVFGLGYDSKMWYEGNNKNTFFVENKDQYINLNLPHIPLNHIIKYEYNTTCETITKMTDLEIENFEIPKELLEIAPFDIIIIDGPEGYSNKSPGRIIPCYWATLLSKTGTIIYIDDSNRPIESFCIKKYFSDKKMVKFPERNDCTKVIY